MSGYANDYRSSRRGDRMPPPEYPPYSNDTYSRNDDHRNRFPPPPMGDALNGKPSSAMKKSDDRSSRVPSHVRPAFPDEGSYLGSHAPDLERKNRPHHQKFREMRDGYESEEGEQLRRARPRRSDGGHDDPGRSRRPPRDSGGYVDEPHDRPARSRRDYYDEPEPRSHRHRADTYGDKDDYSPPRSRRHRPEVEYGSKPIPIHRSNTDRASRRHRDDPPSDYEDGYRPRRQRSADERRKTYDDAPRRRERERRRHSDDDEDYYDRRDRDRHARDRDRDKSHGGRGNGHDLKVGKYDIGQYLEKGQKHYATLAPIVTPIVMTMAKKYLGK